MTTPRPAIAIESTTHADSRVNIPTEELRDFVKPEEAAPKTLLYPRDPSLDPQLVWRGKDEQDREPLEVPAVPIYIQEKIHPRALIEDLRKQSAPPDASQPSLFADFNGIEFDQQIEFYQHEQHWTNRMILGDSLLVMASLAEKEGLKGKVQCIYMDPPYGIKFGSNWQVSTRKRDVRDGNAADVNREPEVIRAFRDTWKLGIHSYLSYLRDRLTVARELLTESGSVFVQIGEDNLHVVRNLLDEVFGSENHVSLISFAKTSGSTGDYLASVNDFLLFYAKDRERLKYRSVFNVKSVDEAERGPYGLVQHSDGTRRRLTSAERSAPRGLPAGDKIYRIDNLQSQSVGREKGEGASSWFPVRFHSREWRPSLQSRWKTNESGMARLLSAGRLDSTAGGLYYVRFIEDFPAFPLTSSWSDTVVAGFASDKKYVVETSTKVIERCLLMATDPGDLVLDPTCGSGTTAYVAEHWGRRWITTDTSRVALALARTRLMAGRFPYYHLADSPEGIRKETELTGQTPPPYKTANDVRKGFVYKRVPHITLKSIANNEEIDVIHKAYDATLSIALSIIEAETGKEFEDWEVPREPGEDWSARAVHELTRWWDLRRRRQAEIDASIARRADVELLYDQPYEDNKRVRVSGPFTVESLSPHRMISVDDKVAAAEEGIATGDGARVAVRVLGADSFGLTIIHYLRKSGVQNGIKKERLSFERLDPYPGEWLNAAGEYLEDGQAKRVAICIGPEFGTVGPELVKQAAKEAVRGVGFDLLIICGFAFDPHVSEEAKRYGALTVLPARMNPDLAMGDELLKKTGAGNLFTVFGEPDIVIEPQSAGQVVVEVRGVDVYDPTTGVVRSNSTDDIACWFIDTDYDEASFFVRHAYFTGADEPYEKLQRALRAEIDPDAWATLYATRSRPFARPSTGKIAVKVINHYGDEVLKVYEVK